MEPDPTRMPFSSLSCRTRLPLSLFLLCVASRSAKGFSTERTKTPVALVTGSTDGIGVTTAKNLSSKGYDVIVHGRDSRRLKQAVATIEHFAAHHSNDPGRVFRLPPIDISTIHGCQRLVSETDALCESEGLGLSVLMNNAGVYSEDHIITEDGLELTFAVNVVAPFIITSRLLPRLLRQKSRIVTASSISQCRSIRSWEDLHYNQRPYSAHAAYSESKLLDAMLTMEMTDRFQSSGIDADRITCNCLDPGTVNTKMLLAGWGPIGIDVEDALDQTWLCSSDEVEQTTGKYFVYQCERMASSSVYDKKEREKMWNLLASLDPEAAKMWSFDWL